MGANARVQRAADEKIQAMGLNKDVIKAAQEIAQELADAEESLELVRGAERSQRNLLAVVDQTMEDAYKAAETALRAGDEATARRQLEERNLQKTKRAGIEAGNRTKDKTQASSEKEAGAQKDAEAKGRAQSGQARQRPPNSGKGVFEKYAAGCPVAKCLTAVGQHFPTGRMPRCKV